MRLSELIGKEKEFIRPSEPVSQTTIMDTMETEGYDPTEVYAELVLMRYDGEIFESRNGVYKHP
jgi:hypothetical protein